MLLEVVDDLVVVRVVLVLVLLVVAMVEIAVEAVVEVVVVVFRVGVGDGSFSVSVVVTRVGVGLGAVVWVVVVRVVGNTAVECQTGAMRLAFGNTCYCDGHRRYARMPKDGERYSLGGNGSSAGSFAWDVCVGSSPGKVGLYRLAMRWMRPLPWPWRAFARFLFNIFYRPKKSVGANEGGSSSSESDEARVARTNGNEMWGDGCWRVRARRVGRPPCRRRRPR